MTDEENTPDRAEYLRQLAIDSLNAFTGGFQELEKMVRDLKSIIHSMTEVMDASQTKSLVRHWGQLEIIYALALNDQRLLLTQEEESDIQTIVARLIDELET